MVFLAQLLCDAQAINHSSFEIRRLLRESSKPCFANVKIVITKCTFSQELFTVVRLQFLQVIYESFGGDLTQGYFDS